MRTGFLAEYRLIYGPWQAFERAIARLLVHKGYTNVSLVGGSGDKGADVIASVGQEEYVFQAKYSERNSKLSVDIVGDVVKAMDFYEIEKGICVSNRQLGPRQKEKMSMFKELGYDIRSVTGGKLLRDFEKLPDWTEDDRILRPYQSHSLNELKESFKSGSNRALISLATGMGKTFVAASFLKWLFENNPQLNVLILAHTKPLIEQFDQNIWKSLPKTVSTHLLHGTEKPSYSDGVLLATFQSIESYFREKEDILFDVVIVDEAHHAAASTYNRTIDHLSPKYLLGLTATPFRMDERLITEIFGEPLVTYDTVQGMRKGYLCDVDYRLKNDNIDREWIAKNSNRGHTIKQLNKKIFIPQRDHEICEMIFEYWKKYQRNRGIIFCNSVEHALRVEKILISMLSMNARNLSTQETSEEVTKRLRMFRKGEIEILTVFDMLNEGVDVPDVDFIVFMRVTHSRIYFLQQLGRGLRYKEGRKLLVLDFVADLRRIGEVRRFYSLFGESSDRSDVEDLQLDENFKLSFSDEETSDFLNLVVRDIEDLENLDESDVVRLAYSEDNAE